MTVVFEREIQEYAKHRIMALERMRSRITGRHKSYIAIAFGIVFVHICVMRERIFIIPFYIKQICLHSHSIRSAIEKYLKPNKLHYTVLCVFHYYVLDKILRSKFKHVLETLFSSKTEISNWDPKPRILPSGVVTKKA